MLGFSLAYFLLAHRADDLMIKVPRAGKYNTIDRVSVLPVVLELEAVQLKQHNSNNLN